MNARHLLLLALVAGSLLASFAVMLSWQRAGDGLSARVALIDSPAAPSAARVPSSFAARPALSAASGPALRHALPAQSPSALPWARTPATLTDRAAIAAAVLNDAAFAHAIEERLDDPDPHVRRFALQLYDEFLRAGAPPALADSVMDSSPPRNAQPLASATE